MSKASRSEIPSYLWRTYSGEGQGRTIGFSSPDLFLPSAHTHGVNQYSMVGDIPVKIAQQMIGSRLKWDNRVANEFLSWSKSLVFAIVHALGRHEQGQRPVYVTFGRARALTTPDAWPAPFYSAVLLHETFKIFSWRWDALASSCLLLKFFTHEILSHGELEDSTHAIAHVNLETLVENGLFDLVSSLRLNGYFKRSNLYESCTAFRAESFSCTRPRMLTREDLALCVRLAGLFKLPADTKPPLHCLLYFLSLHKRDPADEVLRQHIRANYTGEPLLTLAHINFTKIHVAQDVSEGIYPNMEHVADNLPDVVQYVALVRAAAEIFNMPPITPTQLVIRGLVYIDQYYAGHDRMSLLKKARLQKMLKGDAVDLYFDYDNSYESMAARERLAGLSTSLERRKRKPTGLRKRLFQAQWEHKLPRKKDRTAQHDRLAQLNKIAGQLNRRAWSRETLSGTKVKQTPWYQWQRFSWPKRHAWCGFFS
jgi:hypothetical protein